MGGGGGAIDTESPAKKRQKGRERKDKTNKEKAHKSPKTSKKTVKKVHPTPKQHNTDRLKKNSSDVKQ